MNRNQQQILAVIGPYWTDLHTLRRMTKWGCDNTNPYLYRVVHNLIDEGKLECRGGWTGGAFMVRRKA